MEAGRATGNPFSEGRTYLCVEGPRFSTRSESRWFRYFADIIGMTLVPEVTLARERALCYACLAMVTDFDAWAERAVEAREITETMHRNTGRMRAVLGDLLPRIVGPESAPVHGHSTPRRSMARWLAYRCGPRRTVMGIMPAANSSSAISTGSTSVGGTSSRIGAPRDI